MRWIRIGLLAASALTLSCASAGELARRSAIALQGGDADQAYEFARRAVEKDPRSQDALAALHEAVQLKADDWRRRVRNLAEADTLAAAQLSLQFADFRAQASGYRAPVVPDSAYSREEAALHAAAARRWFDLGHASLAEDRPKRAVDQFSEVARYAPRWPGLADTLRLTRQRATTWIALLPLENQTGREGLGRELTEHWYREIAEGLRGKGIRFTRLVPLDQSWAAAGRERDTETATALRIGRDLQVNQVIRGRIYGIDSETRSSRISDLIYRKVQYRDTSGRTVDRYVRVPFEAVTRERNVEISLEYELLSTHDGQQIAGERVRREHRAITAYSSFGPEGSCDHYCWVPPHGAREHSEDYSRGEDAERRWKATGPGRDTSLPSFLETARKYRRRREYRREYLPSFYPDAERWVFLDDLPPAGDLAFAALVNEWSPLIETLRRIDPLDEVDLR